MNSQVSTTNSSCEKKVKNTKGSGGSAEKPVKKDEKCWFCGKTVADPCPRCQVIESNNCYIESCFVCERTYHVHCCEQAKRLHLVPRVLKRCHKCGLFKRVHLNNL